MEKTELRAGIYGAMAEALRDRFGVKNVTEVTSFEQDTEAGGYCDTCYYEDTVVRISYLTEAGGGTYTYYGDMGELIRSLTD